MTEQLDTRDIEENQCNVPSYQTKKESSYNRKTETPPLKGGFNTWAG